MDKHQRNERMRNGDMGTDVGAWTSAAEIVSQVAARTFTALDAVPGKGPSKAVDWSIRYISEHYGRGLQVGELAIVAGLSKFHFLRRFRKETGMTPGMFLQRYRMCKAMERLVQSNCAIQTIAREVGYQDPAAFSRAFLKTIGTQPCLYR